MPLLNDFKLGVIVYSTEYFNKGQPDEEIREVFYRRTRRHIDQRKPAPNDNYCLAYVFGTAQGQPGMIPRFLASRYSSIHRICMGTEPFGQWVDKRIIVEDDLSKSHFFEYIKEPNLKRNPPKIGSATLVYNYNSTPIELKVATQQKFKLTDFELERFQLFCVPVSNLEGMYTIDLIEELSASRHPMHTASSNFVGKFEINNELYNVYAIGLFEKDE